MLNILRPASQNFEMHLTPTMKIKSPMSRIKGTMGPCLHTMQNTRHTSFHHGYHGYFTSLKHTRAHTVEDKDPTRPRGSTYPTISGGHRA